MKRVLKWCLGVVLVLLLLVLGALAYVFFKPEVIVNLKTLRYALNHTAIVQDVTWETGELAIGWNRWNERPFKGRFTGLCLRSEREAMALKTCVDEVSWDVVVHFSFADGFSVTSPGPVVLHTRHTELVLKETAEQKDEPFPNLKSHWDMFWGPMVPDLSIELLHTKVVSSGKTTSFDFRARKTKETLTADALSYHLTATPRDFTLVGPKKFTIPFSLFKERPLDLRDLKLNGVVKAKGIDLTLGGELLTAGLTAQTFVPWPTSGELTIAFQKKVLSQLTAKVTISDVKEFYERAVPLKYAVLPAPLNVMNGSILLDLKTKDRSADVVDLDVTVTVDLKSARQVLDLGFAVSAPLDLRHRSVGGIVLGVEFRQVLLQLPRLSKKALPPQFTPDSRIYNTPFGPAAPKERVVRAKPPLKFDLDLEALGAKALHLRTNLLDEDLRLNFKLSIREGALESGFVQVLPLKTTVFKRPVHVQGVKVTFRHPATPLVEGDIEFPLPNYRIFMHFEGPIDDPRYSFRSKPPLPKDDIYSVLLFGRTMADLGLDDQNSVRRTNQILAQGAFSLAVLYFLAGSPVQYVGYDPETGNGVAQVGLGKKNSVTVRGRDGYNSASVRRAIGKGWYVDTSTETSTTNPNGSRNVGVMLERIIAY